MSPPLYDYDKGQPFCARTYPMSPLPPTYKPASGDEEIERLKELIAEAEELCIEFQVKMYREAQLSQGGIELLSKELQEMQELRTKRAAPQPES